MSKRAICILQLKTPSEKMARIVKTILEPETQTNIMGRSDVTVLQEGINIKLFFTSNDTTALRASINSYIGWLSIIWDIYSEFEKMNNHP